MRLVHHLRGNVVAYIALMVAVISGGGGYAVAATTTHKPTKKSVKKPTTVVACASSKTSELYLHAGKKRCPKGRHKVTWSIKGPKGSQGSRGKTGATGASGAAGPAGPSAAAFGTIGPDAPLALNGMTATKNGGVGSWTLHLTDPACAGTTNVLVVSPVDEPSPSATAPPADSAPVAFGGGSGTVFNVDTGYTAGGTFTQADFEFNAIIECGATPTGQPLERQSARR